MRHTLPGVSAISYRRGDPLAEYDRWRRLGGGGERLLLVTCYPFDALVPGGPLRYVVVADPEPAEMLM